MALENGIRNVLKPEGMSSRHESSNTRSVLERETKPGADVGRSSIPQTWPPQARVYVGFDEQDEDAEGDTRMHHNDETMAERNQRLDDLEAGLRKTSTPPSISRSEVQRHGGSSQNSEEHEKWERVPHSEPFRKILEEAPEGATGDPDEPMYSTTSFLDDSDAPTHLQNIRRKSLNSHQDHLQAQLSPESPSHLSVRYQSASPEASQNPHARAAVGLLNVTKQRSAHEAPQIRSDSKLGKTSIEIALEHRVVKLEEELRVCREELDAKTLEFEEIRADWREQSSLLMQLQSDFTERTVDEDSLLRDFDQLKQKIVSFAANHFSENGREWPHRHKKEPSILKNRTRDLDYYFSFQSLRPWIACSGLWFQLQKLFYGNSWAGAGDLDAFNFLKTTLRQAALDRSIEARDYQTWRAMTSQLLFSAKRTDAENNAIRDMARYLEETVLQYSESPPKEMMKGLMSILRDGVDLAANFRSQKAEYRVLFPSTDKGVFHGFLFNQSNMAEVFDSTADGDKSPIVMLVMTPLVEKRGTAEGENYDQTCIAVKSDVVCRPEWHAVMNEEKAARTLGPKEQTLMGSSLKRVKGRVLRVLE